MTDKSAFVGIDGARNRREFRADKRKVDVDRRVFGRFGVVYARIGNIRKGRHVYFSEYYRRPAVDIQRNYGMRNTYRADGDAAADYLVKVYGMDIVMRRLSLSERGAAVSQRIGES